MVGILFEVSLSNKKNGNVIHLLNGPDIDARKNKTKQFMIR